MDKALSDFAVDRVREHPAYAKIQVQAREINQLKDWF
jgi:hypothetical protein